MPDRIKIANVIEKLTIGGIERLTVPLFSRLATDRFEPFLICVEGGGPMEVEAIEYGVKVIELGKKIRNVPAAAFALSRALRELEIDVVHGNPGLVARLAAPKRAAVVSTYHTMLPGRGYLSLIPDRFFTERTDILVAISDAVALKTARALRIPPECIRVIYNGIDVERTRAMAEEALPEEVKRDGPVISYLGRLVPEKGVDVLLKAFRGIIRDVPDAALWIIGDGPSRARLERDAAGLGKNVRFWGRKLNPFPLLASSDFFCLPSRTAGFELVLPEAMALGLPIVASGTGGIPEVVGDAGILVEPENDRMLVNALVSLLGDEGKRSELSDRSMDRVELFRIERTAAKYAEVYEEAVSLRAKRN
ncbi:MAG: glycosyltransferase [Candidatus Coatesbacteria bacterium]|nr:MAG: glycosyltransferase [Candidatus Coatesbacteria bacterium]